jgi:integrase
MATFTKRETNGKTVWGAQVRRKGHPSISATFERLTDAKRWAARQEAAISEARAVPGSAARRHTVAEVVDRYCLTVLPHKRPKTIVNQKKHLQWWRDLIGHLRLIDVTPAVITDHRDLLARDHAPATVKRYLAALSHAFTIAIREWQWMEENPCNRVSKPSEPRGRVRFLNDEERQRLLDICKTSSGRYLYLVVLIALSTGSRKGEILNLQWADVDLSQGRITFHDTKNSERRTVPLTGPALNHMRQHAKVRRIDTPLVFPNADGTKPLDPRRAWETSLKQANISDFHFHDLRHSAASYLAMNGASLAEIAEVLGHKTLSMVKRYAHLSEAHTAGVVSRMNAKIFGEGE